MKYDFYNWIKIRHYESTIQDVEAWIKIRRKDKKEKRILQFIKQEYKRRIQFFKELDKLEKRIRRIK